MKKTMYILVCLFLFSCNKETNKPAPEVESVNYFPLTVGSYWVYNTYAIDSLGNETLIYEYDTTEIVGDTIIDGKGYVHFFGKNYATQSKKSSCFLRDSASCIVNNFGEVVFTNDLSDSIFIDRYMIENGDTLAHKLVKIINGENELLTPAGEFKNTLTYQLDFTSLKKPVYSTTIKSYYALNVGRINKAWFYVNSYAIKKEYFESRLVAYSILE